MIARYLRLLPRDRRLIVSAAFWQLAVSAILAFVPFARASRLLARLSRPSAASRPIDVTRVAWAVDSMAAALPIPSTCLTRAWTAAILIARRGGAATVTVGVASSDRGPEFHAWVEQDGAVVLGRSSRSHVLLHSIPGFRSCV